MQDVMNGFGHLFISYPVGLTELADKLRDELRQLGIEAWLYEIDLQLGVSTWADIERSIADAKAVVFLVGRSSVAAVGQTRELSLCTSLGKQVVPLVCEGLSFRDLPSALASVNGAVLEYATARGEAANLARAFYPEEFRTGDDVHWVCPRPGEWLEICRINEHLSEYFGLGDVVYFRRLSPLGLFECYAPKILGLFWFYPENLRRVRVDTTELQVPVAFNAYQQYTRAKHEA